MRISMIGTSPRVKESTAAILIATDGRLLFQLRDDVPGISYPGELGFFGGGREGDETFLNCVVREVHEEIGLYIPPERFEFVGRYEGPDPWRPDHFLHGEVFTAHDVPIDQLIVSEGTLRLATFDELEHIHALLAAPAKYALELFLKRSSPDRNDSSDQGN